MASLTNPVTPQNIVDRFADYVTATSNAGITWGTNNLPFAQMPVAYFGGTTAGKPLGISGGSIGASGTAITAANIYNTLLAETAACTRLRLMRALLYVTGGGGNTGSYPSPGYIYDATAKSNLNTNYLQSIGTTANAGVAAGQVISASGLESLFNNLRAAYTAAQNTVATVQVDICHSSCHSSCHASRGRR